MALFDVDLPLQKFTNLKMLIYVM